MKQTLVAMVIILAAVGFSFSVVAPTHVEAQLQTPDIGGFDFGGGGGGSDDFSAGTDDFQDGGIVPKCGEGGQEPCGACELVELGHNVLTFIIFFAAFVAAFLFAWAGFLYVTSGPNPDQISKAHKIFFNVLVGFVIALAAWLIINTILLALVDDRHKSSDGIAPWIDIICAEVDEQPEADDTGGGTVAPSPPVECDGCVDLPANWRKDQNHPFATSKQIIGITGDKVQPQFLTQLRALKDRENEFLCDRVTSNRLHCGGSSLDPIQWGRAYRPGTDDNTSCQKAGTCVVIGIYDGNQKAAIPEQIAKFEEIAIELGLSFLPHPSEANHFVLHQASHFGGGGGLSPVTTSGCFECVNIQGILPLKHGNQTSLNGTLALRLRSFDTAYGNEVGSGKWTITEGYPPSTTHKDPCHSVGTCVDANFRNTSPITITEIHQFSDLAKKANLRPVYEVPNDTQRDQLRKAATDAGHDVTIITVSGVAPHFSVYCDFCDSAAGI